MFWRTFLISAKPIAWLSRSCTGCRSKRIRGKRQSGSLKYCAAILRYGLRHVLRKWTVTAKRKARAESLGRSRALRPRCPSAVRTFICRFCRGGCLGRTHGMDRQFAVWQSLPNLDNRSKPGQSSVLRRCHAYASEVSYRNQLGSRMSVRHSPSIYRRPCRFVAGTCSPGRFRQKRGE